MRAKLREIIFGTATTAGRRFDLWLLVLILLSVGIIMIESVPEWRTRMEEELVVLEWTFTILFTLEYIVRLLVAEKPLKYFLSFWGMVDLLSVIPTYLTFFISGYQSIRMIRALRLLRIFRILKLSRFTVESQALFNALKASYYRIVVFLLFVFLISICAGTIMYVVEQGENGFESIPASIYWAVVTITTVGFGDITPGTDIGKFLATLMMILGYAIIALPTGLVTMEMVRARDPNKDPACGSCGNVNPKGSIFCNQCGNEIITV